MKGADCALPLFYCNVLGNMEFSHKISPSSIMMRGYDRVKMNWNEQPRDNRLVLIDPAATYSSVS